MDKSKLNFVIDVLMFLCLMAMAGLGFLMKFALPSGRDAWAKYGSNRQFSWLGWDRHDWGDIHLYLAFTLLSLLAVICWAGYTVGLRTLPDGFSPLRVTTVTTIAGTPGLVLVGLPGLLRLEWGAVPGTAWAALAYATLLSLVVAYVLWNRSVQAVGGTRTAIYMCVTPLVAVGAAWVMLGEHARPLQGVGAVLIVAGVLLTRW